MKRRLRPPTTTLPPHVVIRTFALETILLDVQTGTYYGLSPDQGVMLECLLGHGTISAAAQVLAEAGWGAVHEIVDELRALCAQLEQLALLRQVAA